MSLYVKKYDAYVSTDLTDEQQRRLARILAEMARENGSDNRFGSIGVSAKQPTRVDRWSDLLTDRI